MKTRKRIEALSDKQKRIIGIFAFVLFFVFCIMVGWFIGRPMIKFVSQPEEFRRWVDSHGIFGRITMVVMMAFQVVIALIPGEPLEIGAGYAFGAVEGTVLCVIGITLGSLLVFILVRRFGIKFLEIFFSLEKIKGLKILQKSKKRDLLLFLVFFMPGTPKDLITYFAGITDVKTFDFIIFVSLARLPSIISSAIGGGALGVEKYSGAVKVFAVTIVISIVGWIVYQTITKIKYK